MKLIVKLGRGAIGTAILAAAVCNAQVAAANVITVTTQDMDVGFGNGCTLTEAVTAANNGSNFSGCNIQNDGSGFLAIVVPDGDYVATGPLTLTADVEVFASPATTIHTGSDWGIGVTGDGDGPRVVLNGLTVQGADAPVTSIVGLYADNGATLVARNVTVTNCNGAGVLTDGATLEMDNSDVSDNGVGVQVSNGTASLFANSIFGNDGDGLFVDASTVEATQSFFNGNGGNGILVNGSGRVVVTQSNLAGNGENGAELLNDWDNDVSLDTEQFVADDCLFQGNAESGLYNESGEAIVQRSQISGNSNSGLRNNALTSDATITCLDSTIRDNFAEFGGGIWNSAGSDSKLYILRTALLDNVAFEDGGGVFSLGQPFFSDSTFSGNFAFGDGGGIYATGNELNIFHTTITGNQALGMGGGIYAFASQPRVFYSVIAGNTAPFEGQADVVASLLTGRYSFIGEPFETSDWGPFTENTQFGVDPKLGPLQNVDGVAWAYPPLPDSPVIDAIPLASCETSTVLGGPSLDQRGLGRPADENGCDAGSIEFGELGTLPDIEALNWTSSTPLSLSSEHHTEGYFGLSVGGGGYRVVNSDVVGGVTQAESNMLLDVFVPPNPPDPYWQGSVQMFATCASANIYNTYMGQQELTGLPQGAFSPLSFSVSDPLKAALAQQGGCFFSIAVNANQTSTAPVIDNLRFTAP